jgi:hypothetical protein
MAYAATVTLTRKGNDYVVTISETDAAAGSEATIEGLPITGRVQRQMCSLTAGTGTTVDPKLTLTSGGTGVNIVVENGSASANVDNVSSPAVPFANTDAVMYHMSVVDADTDNSITTVYYISGGTPATGW